MTEKQATFSQWMLRQRQQRRRQPWVEGFEIRLNLRSYRQTWSDPWRSISHSDDRRHRRQYLIIYGEQCTRTRHQVQNFGAHCACSATTKIANVTHMTSSWERRITGETVYLQILWSIFQEVIRTLRATMELFQQHDGFLHQLTVVRCHFCLFVCLRAGVKSLEYLANFLSQNSSFDLRMMTRVSSFEKQPRITRDSSRVGHCARRLPLRVLLAFPTPSRISVGRDSTGRAHV